MVFPTVTTPATEPTCVPRILLLNDVPTSYPFKLAKCPSQQYFQVCFKEFHGRGPPTNEFGSPGDVYFDFQTKDHELYGRLSHSWEKYVDQHSVIVHPYLPNYRLERASITSDCNWVWFRTSEIQVVIIWALSAEDRSSLREFQRNRRLTQKSRQGWVKVPPWSETQCEHGLSVHPSSEKAQAFA